MNQRGEATLLTIGSIAGAWIAGGVAVKAAGGPPWEAGVLRWGAWFVALTAIGFFGSKLLASIWRGFLEVQMMRSLNPRLHRVEKAVEAIAAHLGVEVPDSDAL